MTIQYTQTVDDVLHLTWYYYRTNRSLQIIFFLLLCLIVFSVVSSISVGRYDLALTWALPISMVIAIWYFITPWLTRRRLLKPENRHNVEGERTIVISEEHLAITTPETDGHFKWSAFKKLKQSKLCYFLYISSVQAVLVPKRAFSSDEQRAEFESQVSKNTELKWT